MYSGTIVPLITPLDMDTRVDTASVARLIESVHRDVAGLMPTLSSGEGWKLSETQWRDMVAATCEHSRGLPVLAGIQLPETGQVIERARLAKELGVDAVVVTTPFQADISQDEIFAHYQALRAAVDIPLFIYNEAAVSGNTIELETLLRIFALPGVVGIKESSGSAELTRRIVRADHTVPVFEGWENLLLEAHGVAGFIGPLANLEPQLCNAMLVDPTPERQATIDETCRRYGVFEDDWYRLVKQELCKRKVIGTDLVVEERT
ncbi:4-hydroxy-tetrahydrodipicolinate synthase [Kibdelosporangium banguiense]|uniref:4-hydroxy-tetrahydrodipicolinate synthase n=1 Tax=Kibdelosporangium banguiense TaxID=1365924 RepID=A0ABS4TXJ9_9PSEU|nr:dihydrodipicolinate synthase family protein [Kibdelosporangium banguiense]MBP2328748.1 4-hydroxy-tetrahydrodipicolinate synthase [Kibdelosporangium banguiense]